MATRQSGTITFLMTDIVGSTRRWEADREEMSRSLEIHDATLREAIESRGGEVFKTVGDAFCAAFPDARPAVDAAVAIQRALRTSGLAVRIGIHSGEAEIRDNDYFGPAVNRAARICSAANAKQVLLSDAARALVVDTLPGIDTIDLGVWRLKDIPEPLHLWQLRAPGLSEELRRPAAEGVSKARLPSETTSFVGREAELTQVLSALGESRLVTLVGPGGVGKTRLSIRAARLLAESLRDGAWFVDLAPLLSGDDVVKAAAVALEIPEMAGAGLREALLGRLGGMEALIVLDNCEHLLDPVADLVSDALEGAPSVRLLATSREPLALQAERCLEVRPLDEPGSGPSGISMAARLLVERARAVLPGFEIDAENADDISAICARLDHLPLAIELAAARLRIFTPRELRDGLEGRFSSLDAGLRGLAPRQRSLDALFDWSWDLLSAEERRCLASLSVFRGHFGLGAVEAVVGPDGIESLASLVAKSLVARREEAAESRYSLLDTIRAFAARKLDASGAREAVESALLAWCAAATRGFFFGRFDSSRIVEATGFLERERWNVFEAIDAGLRRRDPRAAEISAELAPYWELGVDCKLGLQRLVAAADLIGEEVIAVDPVAYTHVLSGAVIGAVSQERIDQARAFAERLRVVASDDPRLRVESMWADYWIWEMQRRLFGSTSETESSFLLTLGRLDDLIARLRDGEDSKLLSQALYYKGSILIIGSRPAEGVRCLEEALGIAWDRKDAFWIMTISSFLAFGTLGLGDAQRCHEIAVATIPAAASFQALGDLYMLENCAGGALRVLDRPKEAIPHYRRQLEIARQSGIRHRCVSALFNLLATFASLGEAEEASLAFQECLELLCRSGAGRNTYNCMFALVGAAYALEAEGEGALAARALGASGFSDAGIMDAGDFHSLDLLEGRITAALGDERCLAEKARGAKLGPKGVLSQLVDRWPFMASMA